MITTPKLLGLLAVAFVAGSFVASPELRAYAANTVRSIDIVDGQVLTADLGGNSVTAAKIKDGEVKATEIATDGVGAAEIATNAVGGSEIATDAVGASEIAANAVGSSEIATDAVGTDEIAKDAVGVDEIAKDTVGASEIMGVDKLIFADCAVPTGTLSPSASLVFSCTIAGVDSEDNAVATLTLTNSDIACLVLIRNDPGEGNVTFRLRNVCDTIATIPPSIVSVIVYDELPDKIPPTLP